MKTSPAMTKEQRLEERIRAILLKEKAPVKRWYLQRQASSRDHDASMFHRVLQDMRDRGVLTIDDATMVELLDRRKPAPRYRDRRLATKQRRVMQQAELFRAAVWDKTGGACWYCGRQTNPFRDFHIDHVVPVSADGTNDIENLVPCCAGCNFAKGAKPLQQFRQMYPTGHRFFFERHTKET